MIRRWKSAVKKKKADGSFYTGLLDRFDNDPGDVYDGVHLSYAEATPEITREYAIYCDRWNEDRVAEGPAINSNTRSNASSKNQYGTSQRLTLQNVASRAGGNPKHSEEWGLAVKGDRKRQWSEGEKGSGKR